MEFWMGRRVKRGREDSGDCKLFMNSREFKHFETFQEKQKRSVNFGTLGNDNDLFTFSVINFSLFFRFHKKFFLKLFIISTELWSRSSSVS